MRSSSVSTSHCTALNCHRIALHPVVTAQTVLLPPPPRTAITKLRRSSAEPAGPGAAEERSPLGAGERQHRPVGVLGIAQRNAVGQVGNLDAVAVHTAVTAAAL